MQPINEHTNEGPGPIKKYTDLDTELYRQIHLFGGVTLALHYDFDADAYREYFESYKQLLQYCAVVMTKQKLKRAVTPEDIEPSWIENVGMMIAAYMYAQRSEEAKQEMRKALFPEVGTDEDADRLIHAIDTILSAMPEFPKLTPKER